MSACAMLPTHPLRHAPLRACPDGRHRAMLNTHRATCLRHSMLKQAPYFKPSCGTCMHGVLCAPPTPATSCLLAYVHSAPVCSCSVAHYSRCAAQQERSSCATWAACLTRMKAQRLTAAAVLRCVAPGACSTLHTVQRGLSCTTLDLVTAAP
jgi:hypothetical protein